MRAVSFIKRVGFPYSGNIHQHALTLGDVDNDGNNELIIGNTNGELFIYKEEERIQTIDKLGMISAVGVGDIMNCGSNVLAVISGDGWCHVFLCLSSHYDETEGTPFKLELVHVQQIPANAKVILIEDIDNDGSLEMVIGLTDRVVRSYRWKQNFTGGKLVCLNKWECANQIGNITLNYDQTNEANLLISQPGATFMRIQCFEDVNNLRSEMKIDYISLFSKKVKNFNISSQIIGNLNMRPPENCEDLSKDTLYAVATLDGTLMLLKDKEVIWTMHLDQQLFTLCKMDMTGDGYEELIACSWEGNTYILDRNKHVVRFQFDEPVAAFCAGTYKLSVTKVALPCLIYCTYSGKVQICYDVGFTDITVKNMLHVIENDCSLQTKQLFQQAHGNYKPSDKRKFMKWLLYGNHDLRK